MIIMLHCCLFLGTKVRGQLVLPIWSEGVVRAGLRGEAPGHWLDLDGACETFNLCIPFETTDLVLFDTSQSWSYRGTRVALTHVVDLFNLGLALGHCEDLYNQYNNPYSPRIPSA
jgi:hypothetical protein